MGLPAGPDYLRGAVGPLNSSNAHQNHYQSAGTTGTAAVRLPRSASRGDTTRCTRIASVAAVTSRQERADVRETSTAAASRAYSAGPRGVNSRATCAATRRGYIPHAVVCCVRHGSAGASPVDVAASSEAACAAKCGSATRYEGHASLNIHSRVAPGNASSRYARHNVVDPLAPSETHRLE